MEHWLEREIERGTGDDTLYLQLYGIEHMVKNHLVRETPTAATTRATDKIAHTTAFVIPVVEHWLEREIERGTGDDTLYLQLYGIEHMVKNHLVRETPTAATTRATDKIAHTKAFVIPVVEHWL